MSIYVEILIRAPMEAVWTHTQTPGLHERWDLRFSRIDYLPRRSEAEPQRFHYATRIGPGLEVTGEGESSGDRDLASGSRSSALRFSSSDSRSIIREGAGYWKYIPTAEGTVFLPTSDGVGHCLELRPPPSLARGRHRSSLPVFLMRQPSRGPVAIGNSNKAVSP